MTSTYTQVVLYSQYSPLPTSKTQGLSSTICHSDIHWSHPYPNRCKYFHPIRMLAHPIILFQGWTWTRSSWLRISPALAWPFHGWGCWMCCPLCRSCRCCCQSRCNPWCCWILNVCCLSRHNVDFRGAMLLHLVFLKLIEHSILDLLI